MTKENPETGACEETRHTPGPWASYPTGRHMKEDYCQPFAVVSGAELSNLICGCFGDGQGGVPAAKANANLIAAAPELHRAARDASDLFAALLQLGPDVTGAMLSVMNALDRALAKAEGRE